MAFSQRMLIMCKMLLGSNYVVAADSVKTIQSPLHENIMPDVD